MITADQILDEFIVDSLRGGLFRKTRGELATPILTRRTWCQGYPTLVIGKRSGEPQAITCHRAMWIVCNGDIPEGFVLDHKNGQKSDYRISNLRLVTVKENAQNLNPFTQTGKPRGVTKYGKQWKSGLTVNGDLIHLGVFKTTEEAHAAYQAAKNNYHVFDSEDYKNRGLFMNEIIDRVGGKKNLQKITLCDSETLKRWIKKDGVQKNELRPVLAMLESAGLNVTYSSLYEVSGK